MEHFLWAVAFDARLKDAILDAQPKHAHRPLPARPEPERRSLPRLLGLLGR